MNRSVEDFIHIGSHGLVLRPFGQVMRNNCPVCGSTDIGNVFRLPMGAIDPPISVFGGYFNQIPVLKTPFEIFAWDLCRNCNAIYLNPSASRERINSSYRASTSYLQRMADPGTWSGHEERYDALVRFAPSSADTLVDAACGGGHTLFLAQRGRDRPWKRLIGLELSEAYVANLREHGIEAHVFDLDRDADRAVVAPGSADLISFQEAFEHVERPLAAVAKLLDMLRPGGRLYFSAQRYGDDVNLAILAGEPIYIGPRVVELIPKLLPCTLVDGEKYGARYLIAVERTSDPVTEAHLAIGLDAAPEPANIIGGRGTADEPAVITLAMRFEHEVGHCWMTNLDAQQRGAELRGMSDQPHDARRSPVVLLENGAPIGTPHCAHDDIRRHGAGRYSHWGDTLYFSTSDNTDPNRNGRAYALTAP
jgi:SAM-dependent methyltransferase